MFNVQVRDFESSFAREGKGMAAKQQKEKEKKKKDIKPAILDRGVVFVFGQLNTPWRERR